MDHPPARCAYGPARPPSRRSRRRGGRRSTLLGSWVSAAGFALLFLRIRLGRCKLRSSFRIAIKTILRAVRRGRQLRRSAVVAATSNNPHPRHAAAVSEDPYFEGTPIPTSTCSSHHRSSWPLGRIGPGDRCDGCGRAFGPHPRCSVCAVAVHDDQHDASYSEPVGARARRVARRHSIRARASVCLQPHDRVRGDVERNRRRS